MEICLIYNYKNQLMIKPVIIALFIFLFTACKKENTFDDINVPNNTTPVQMRQVDFILAPQQGFGAAGDGSIYYKTKDSSVVYVFGSENNPETWTGTNTAQSVTITCLFPPAVEVNYLFSGEVNQYYDSPLLTIVHVTDNQIYPLSAISSNLVGKIKVPD